MAASVIGLAVVLLAAACAVPAVAGDDDAHARLDALLLRARDASVRGDARGAAHAFDAIATFYRGGGDRRSAAVADLEAARWLVVAGHWSEASATLAVSEGDETDVTRIAQRHRVRAAALARRRNVEPESLDPTALAPLLVLEWGALIALVVFVYRRGGSGDA